MERPFVSALVRPAGLASSLLGPNGSRWFALRGSQAHSSGRTGLRWFALRGSQAHSSGRTDEREIGGGSSRPRPGGRGGPRASCRDRRADGQPDEDAVWDAYVTLNNASHAYDELLNDVFGEVTPWDVEAISPDGRRRASGLGWSRPASAVGSRRAWLTRTPMWSRCGSAATTGCPVFPLCCAWRRRRACQLSRAGQRSRRYRS